MKIQTLTIVAGTAVCNASCPYCVSKMTPRQGVSFKEPEVNWHNFDKACRLAQVNDVSTVLFTGKGEPTLYPQQITSFLKHIKKFEFPLIELQTNALVFGREFSKYKKYLKEWYNLGLNTIAISIVHYKREKSKNIFTPNSDYIDLEKVIKSLHELGYSIRLGCVLLKEYIDSVKEVNEIVDFAKRNNVEQLTLRPLGTPNKSEDKKVYEWTKKHELSENTVKSIVSLLEDKGTKLMVLPHGAVIYDLRGQNVCLADCFTLKPESEVIRSLIFFPDGHLRYDWRYAGAILM